MNIHIRAFGRLLQISIIPALIGVAIAIAIETLSRDQLINAVIVSAIVGMFALVYSIILEQVRAEDKLQSLNSNSEKFDK